MTKLYKLSLILTITTLFCLPSSFSGENSYIEKVPESKNSIYSTYVNLIKNKSQAEDAVNKIISSVFKNEKYEVSITTIAKVEYLPTTFTWQVGVECKAANSDVVKSFRVIVGRYSYNPEFSYLTAVLDFPQDKTNIPFNGEDFNDYLPLSIRASYFTLQPIEITADFSNRKPSKENDLFVCLKEDKETGEVVKSFNKYLATGSVFSLYSIKETYSCRDSRCYPLTTPTLGFRLRKYFINNNELIYESIEYVFNFEKMSFAKNKPLAYAQNIRYLPNKKMFESEHRKGSSNWFRKIDDGIKKLYLCYGRKSVFKEPNKEPDVLFEYDPKSNSYIRTGQKGIHPDEQFKKYTKKLDEKYAIEQFRNQRQLLLQNGKPLISKKYFEEQLAQLKSQPKNNLYTEHLEYVQGILDTYYPNQD